MIEKKYNKRNFSSGTSIIKANVLNLLSRVEIGAKIGVNENIFSIVYYNYKDNHYIIQNCNKL